MTEPERLTEHATEEDHEGEGSALLARQFADKPRVDALLRSLLAGVQVCEDDTWDLYGLAIDDSSDAALDQIGVILAQPRPDSMTDAVYRKVLRGVVLALKSSGTGDEVERAVYAMVGAWATVTEVFPATFIVRPVSEPDVPAAVLLAVLRRLKSAGVGLQVIDVGPTPRFRFSSSTEEVVAASSSGLGDSTGAVSGGELVGVVA